MSKSFKNVKRELLNLVSEYGLESISECVREISEERNSDVLTIISDVTMHKVPEDLLIGEVFEFSSGSMDISSDETLQSEIVSKLRVLVSVLKSKSWRQIRLIYAGHSLLPANIKLTVYRITHLDTIDIGYFGAVGYRELFINARRDLL